MKVKDVVDKKWRHNNQHNDTQYDDTHQKAKLQHSVWH
jgi:hypothetical protein